MANYVRFQRGTQAAYDKLKAENRLSDYTLYSLGLGDTKPIKDAIDTFEALVKQIEKF